MSSSAETAVRQKGDIPRSEVRRYMQSLGGSTYVRNRAGESANVVIVPDAVVPYVIKRPYDPNTVSFTSKEIAAYEANILNLYLDHLDSAPVEVPIILEYDPGSSSLAAEYMPGNTLTDDQIERMTDQEQVALGKKLARFVDWMARAIPKDNDVFQRLYKSPVRPYDKRARLIVSGRIVPYRLDYIGQHTLAAMTEDLFNEYLSSKKADKIKARYIVGHNDLKPSNWGFGNDTQGNLDLISIFDFGQTTLTTPEQEFRRLPVLGDTVLYSALEEYAKLTGVVLNEDVVKFWTKVHFVDFANNIAFGTANRQRLPFVITQLQKLYPDFDTRELTGDIQYHYSK